MHYLHNLQTGPRRPYLGSYWPDWWLDNPSNTFLRLASELAGLDAESPEHWEALFYGLLDLEPDELVETYRARI